MNKITVIVLTKAQEAITDILALELPPAPAPEMELPPAPAPEMELPPAPAPAPEAKYLDSEGLPWDERIHSSGKTFLAKGGTWKLARGVDSLQVAQIKTELRQAQGGVLLAPVVSTLPPALDIGLTWAQLMEKIAEAGTDLGEVATACQKFNVLNISVLQDTPVLVPLVAKELGF